MAEKTFTLENRNISSAGTVINLSDEGVKFYKKYWVGVTVLDGQYYANVSNKTLDEFSFNLNDSNGVGVNGVVDIHLKGY